MQYDTAGNPIIFYDQCAFCELDTGGNHKSWCPLYQPLNADNRLKPILSFTYVHSPFWELTQKGLEDIRAGRIHKIPNIRKAK